MEQKKLSGAKAPKATKPIQAPSGKTDTKLKKQDRAHQPLERINFIIMGCAGAAIILGFLLMLGGGSTTETFNPDIFSTRRIVIGPLFAFLGFVAMAVGIIIRPKGKKSDKSNE